MKYYCIVSTIEIKTAVPPCRDINSKNCAIFATLQHFRPFLLIFKNHFIDHFYNIFRSSKSGPRLSQLFSLSMAYGTRRFNAAFTRALQ